MALNVKGFEYLTSLQEIEDWTLIPDSDPRIVKLREMYGGPTVPITRKSIRKKVAPKPRFRVKATKDGVSTIYEGANSCSEALGIKVHTIYSAISTGYKTDGITMEKLPNL